MSNLIKKHLSPDGKWRNCKARSQEDCKYKNNQHFEGTQEEFEKTEKQINTKQYGILPKYNIKERKPQNKYIRDFGVTDCSAVRYDVDDTLKKYLDKKGYLAAEREELHKNVIDKIFENKVPPKTQPIFTIMGGGPASGKSSILKKEFNLLTLPEGNVTLNADDVKEEIPEYKEGIFSEDEKMRLKAAATAHAESSALTKRVLNIAVDNKFNTTLDGTGNGSVEALVKKISKAKEAGMRVEGHYVTIPTNKAVQRSHERYLRGVVSGEGGRAVPETILRKIHKNVSDILPQTAHLFDKVVLYDNDVPRGEKPILIATGGAGQSLKPVKDQEKRYESFLQKANE